jgi:hypothetical protein
LLVVNRLDFLRAAEERPEFVCRAPPVGSSHESVFRQYRGFDGFAWPELERLECVLDGGLADLGDLPLVEAYRRGLPHDAECETVLIARDLPLGIAIPGWRLAGFDLGYFEAEYSHFSVLLNEVLYGSSEALCGMKARLNGHLLASSLEVVDEIMALRSRLAATGADLEEMTSIEAIPVHIRDQST